MLITDFGGDGSVDDCQVKPEQLGLDPQYVCAASVVILARYKSLPAERAPCLTMYCADASFRATVCETLYKAICSLMKLSSASARERKRQGMRRRPLSATERKKNDKAR